MSGNLTFTTISAGMEAACGVVRCVGLLLGGKPDRWSQQPFAGSGQQHPIVRPSCGRRFPRLRPHRRWRGVVLGVERSRGVGNQLDQQLEKHAHPGERRTRLRQNRRRPLVHVRSDDERRALLLGREHLRQSRVRSHQLGDGPDARELVSRRDPTDPNDPGSREPRTRNPSPAARVG